MSLARVLSPVMLVVSMSGGNALASNLVLSGFFDGADVKTQPLPGTCAGTDPLAYQTAGTIQVSQSGTYTVSDAYNFIGVDVSALVYSGSFDPQAPANNLLTQEGVDFSAKVELQQGTEYVIVVQHWCENREGAWAVSISGPGNISSADAAEIPAMTEGVFTSNNATMNSDCGNTRYQQSGPQQVATSGTYYYNDMSARFGVDMCLQIYSAPVDPQNPAANRVGSALDDFGSVELVQGQNYYFVTQPFKSSETGEFFYIFAPPAPFRVNKGLSGNWYDPATNGQGFAFDALISLNLFTLSWFTFDLERPDPGVTALIGEPGHRWMTALGPIDGDTVNMDIYWASGMVFDSAYPPLNLPQLKDGTISIKFISCVEAILDYDLGSKMVSGRIPIQPIAGDAIPLCKSLSEGPGQPGPL